MQKASDLVQSFYKHFDIRDDKGYSGFFKAWRELVGENLAGHCQPADIRKGMLIVRVDHPGWMQEMKLVEKQVLKTIQKQFPSLEIRRLAFRFESYDQPADVAKTGIEPNLPAEDIISEASAMVTERKVNPEAAANLGDVLESFRKTLQQHDRAKD